MIIKSPIQQSLRCYLSVSVLFVLFNFGTTTTLTAQSVITVNDSTPGNFIGKSVYYAEDPKNELSYPEITEAKYDTRFKKCKQENPNFGNKETIIWNKFSICNRSSKKWFLSVLNYNIDTLTLFYKDTAGHYTKVVSGSALPFSTREIQTGSFSFRLPLPINDTVTFFMKVQSYIPQYPMLLSSEEQFIYDLHINNLLKGLYYGLVLMFIIYNMALYVTLKDRNYLYFILNIFFTALLMSEHAGINALLWGDQLHFMWSRGPMILAIGSLFFLLFSRSFLETKKYAPRSHQFINFILIPLVFLSMFCNMLDKNLYSSVLNQLTGVLILVFMTFTAIAIYRKGFRSARFYILACSFYFIGVIIFILKTFAILPYNYFTSNSMELGSAAEMMLFSVSMADRMKLFKREKNIAQKELVKSLQENELLITEQNKILEVKVEERTSELQNTLGALELSRQELQEKNTVITHEKERSDELLLNILPEEVAEELKEKGSAEAKLFESVTVMFTDFKGFTQISQKLSPTQLVNEINICFKAFDEIITKHNIEKIKTIGDSYMCAGGLPVANTTHPTDVVLAGLEIQQYMEDYKKKKIAAGELFFEIRIGIHTGSVVAGIVGVKKFQYDIWGESVNTASRMESSGVPGKVNISGDTYQLVKGEFKTYYRGKIDAKNMEAKDMYFVEGKI